VAPGAGGVDRRAVVLTAVALALLGALVPAVVGGAAAPDAGIYRAGVSPGSPYYAPLSQDARFSVASPDPGAVAAGRVDLQVRGRRLVVADDRKGQAAAAAFRDAVEAYNDRLMAREPDQAAAFPVTVNLRYVARDVSYVRARGGSTGGGGDGSAGGTSGGGTGTAGSGGSTSGAGGSGTGGTGASGGSGTATGGSVGATGGDASGGASGGGFDSALAAGVAAGASAGGIDSPPAAE